MKKKKKINNENHPWKHDHVGNITNSIRSGFVVRQPKTK